MIQMSLAEVAAYAGGTLVDTSAGERIPVTAAVTDTRQITEGALFVAIRGARVDGATLAGDALARGAAAVLTENPDAAAASGMPAERIIAVPDVLAALGLLAAANVERARAEGNPDLRIVAVTGSVGKTTTKDLLASILAVRGPLIAPPGSFNNEIGLPLTALRVDANTATFVAEMGASHIGNIAYLTSIAAPDVAVELIVARAHLGEFGGIENVAIAKSELIQGEVEGGTSVLNFDDERVMDMRRFAKGEVLTFSPSGAEGADVRPRQVSLDAQMRASFTLVTPVGETKVSLGLIGVHHVANAVAAAAASLALGVGLDDIAAGLSVGPASPHRMDVFDARLGGANITVIDDSYNANPESMRAGIAALGSIGEGRKVAVLGEMLELGEASAAEHAALAKPLEDAGVSALLAVGPEAEPLARAAAERSISVTYVPDTADAQAAFTAMLAHGDTVLIKGSHGSGVWRIADALKEN